MTTVSAVLLLLFLSCVSGDTLRVYGLKGQSTELPGQQLSTAVTYVEWKKGLHKVAEWETGDIKETYYGDFENRAVLSLTTGSLTISQLSSSFDGIYTVEINKMITPKSIQLIVLEPVSKPAISKECSSACCTLTCAGVESPYTQYNWTDTKGHNVSGPVWRVEKSTELDVIYTCNFSNPLSWSNASISETDMFSSTGPLDGFVKIGIGIGTGIGGIFLGFLLGFVVAPKWCKKNTVLPEEIPLDDMHAAGGPGEEEPAEDNN